MAQTFAIASLDEAKAYLQHPVLARNIHEDFYCNRRYAAATSLAADFVRLKRAGSPVRYLDILFKYALVPQGSARPSRVASWRFRHELS